jgi:hypothetical protein
VNRCGTVGVSGPEGASKQTPGQTGLSEYNCIHTIVILDDQRRLKVDDLLDMAGSMIMPMGGVPTGLGGTAPRPASPAAPWLVTAGAGGLLALPGSVGIRRSRRRPLHSR